MQRRQFLGGLSALAPISTGSNLPGGAPRRMNVLHIIADQHHAACLRHAGHSQVITPNLDRLAEQGVRFTRAYAQNPICTPSRVSIFSGQYCHNHGYYGLSGPVPVPELPSFLLHFRRHGYRTAAFGKIHTPDDPVNWLKDHTDELGECYSYAPGGSLSAAYEKYLQARGVLQDEDSVRLPEFPGVQQHDARPSRLPYEHSVEGWSVSQAIRFIDSSPDRPFCVQVSLPRPHQCYTPDRKFWEMYPDDLALPSTLYDDPSLRPPHFQAAAAALKRMKWLVEPRTFEAGCRRVWRGYLACITQVDYAVGQLMAYLERTGQIENTVIVYGADHGAYSGQHGIPEKAPGICSDAVCRVPLIWRVPGVPATGRALHDFVENIDIAPTLASLCGLPPMTSTDGYNLSDLLHGAGKALREVAVTENPWSKGLRWGPWRFVHYQREMFGKDVGELYNLDEDPEERCNLYHDGSAQPVVEQSRRLLLEWLIRTTRIKTMHPTLPGRAEDGKESNESGPAARAQRKMLAYL